MRILINASFGGGFFILLYYLPIYFQAVQGTSARQSGIRNLALIIADSMYHSRFFDCHGWIAC